MVVLPVSMEDTELFPSAKTLDITPGTFYDELTISEMVCSLDSLWWSRLVISTRGFVVNLISGDEGTIFMVDDAFTAVHVALSENKQPAVPKQFVRDLYKVTTYPSVSSSLSALAGAGGRRVPDASPFADAASGDAFRRIFGAPNETTYKVANGQKYAYLVFSRILSTLQKRWIENKEKKKSIRFETDPEWHPDERVVIFEQLYQGNRTWVLLDFDRHVLRFWRPKGASIIFGDRFIEKKKREGLHVCGVCGMLEQCPGQFVSVPDNELVVCSAECASELR